MDLAASRFEVLRDASLVLGAKVLRHQDGEVRANQFPSLVSEYSGRRGIRKQDHAPGVHRDDAVGRGFGQYAITLLAFRQPLLGARTFQELSDLIAERTSDPELFVVRSPDLGGEELHHAVNLAP